MAECGVMEEGGPATAGGNTEDDDQQTDSSSQESDSSSASGSQSGSSSGGSDSESESDKSDSKSDGVSDEGERYHAYTESESETTTTTTNHKPPASSQKASRKKIRDLKEESEESESPTCRKSVPRRRRKNISSSESDSDDSSERQLSRSRTSNKKPKKISNKKRHSVSSDEDYSDSDSQAKHKLRNKKKKVSYKEQSPDESESEDKMEYEEQPIVEVSDSSSETIEKVLTHRNGKKGATGGITTVYAVEDNGDPNDPDCEDRESQYLIKWNGWAHIHNTWETEQTLRDQKANGLKKLENYIRKDNQVSEWKRRATPEDVEYFEIADEVEEQLRQKYLNVERIIAHKTNETGGTDYYCKWEALPYQHCTWEADHIVARHFQPVIQDYFTRLKSPHIPLKNCKAFRHKPKFTPIKIQPSFLGARENMFLRDYQLEGLNWLVSSWSRENSVILADEMGLGKTIQTISFLSYLFHEFEVYGPFLIVVPLTTLTSWQKEFSEWAPTLNVVAYIGNIPSRDVIRSLEWCHPGNKRLKFNVILTTYEIVLKDKSFLSNVEWAVLAVDEAHRLKNDDSLLYKSLIDFKTNFRLLITGTPLQNSLKELWALLHFIMPHKFVSWEEFEHDHQGADQKGYSKLHKQLEPFLLRRVKKDVEKSLPAKVERILRVGMTTIQKQYYKWILTKNYKELSKGQGNSQRFANIIIELKKCCNHASLIRPIDGPNMDSLQRLLRGSGKLLLLDKLLCKLFHTGHRVLIFSQMVRMLDIIGDYLQLRHFPFQRLDGTIKGEVRKQALEHFNAEGSQDFCFLLSTRAGGLGINLATADTVIIYDSDWNPQNDLQAQARAHRIGQKNQVNIYRLATMQSVEETILERAKNKMVLDHLVIQRMEGSQRGGLGGKGPSSGTVPFNKEELSSILKFGAENLFTDNNEEGPEEEVDIDDILSRAETREDQQVSASDELLSAFKMASFNFKEEEEIGTTRLDSTEKKGWDEIIPLEERMKYEEERIKEETMDIGPRRSRKATEKAKRSEDSDDDKKKYSGSEADNSEEERPRKRGRPRLNPKESIKGFTDAEIRRFVRSYKKFPNPIKRLENIALDADLQDKNMSDLRKIADQIHTNCQNLTKAKQENSEEGGAKTSKKRGPSFKLAGVLVNVKSILAAGAELEPLDALLPSDPEQRERWVLSCSKYKEVHWDVTWSIKEDSALLRGIYEHGMGNWESIKMDSKLNLMDKILPDEAQQPQAKNLQTRAEYLLKILKKQLEQQKAGLVDVPKKARKPRLEKRQHLSKAIVENDDSNDSDSKAGSKKKTKSEDRSLNPDQPSTSQQSVDSKKSEKKKKKSNKDKTKKVPPVMHFTANAEPKVIGQAQEIDQETFLQCKEKMRPMKKALKELDNPDPKLTNDDQVKTARQCLIKIGDHINECLKEYQNDPALLQEWRCHLWIFVSWFTEFNAKKLYKLYKHAIRKEENGPRGNGSGPPALSPGPSRPKKNHNSEDHGSKKRPASTDPSNSNKRPHYDNSREDDSSEHRAGGNGERKSPPNSYSSNPHRNYGGRDNAERRSNWSNSNSSGGGYSKDRYDYNQPPKRDHYGGSRAYSRDDGYTKQRDKDHRGPRRDGRFYHQGPPPHHNNNPYNNPPFNSQYHHGGYSGGSYGGGGSNYHGSGGDSWRRKPDNFRQPPPPYSNNNP